MFFIKSLQMITAGTSLLSKHGATFYAKICHCVGYMLSKETWRTKQTFYNIILQFSFCMKCLESLRHQATLLSVMLLYSFKYSCNCTLFLAVSFSTATHKKVLLIIRFLIVKKLSSSWNWMFNYASLTWNKFKQNTVTSLIYSFM